VSAEWVNEYRKRRVVSSSHHLLFFPIGRGRGGIAEHEKYARDFDKYVGQEMRELYVSLVLNLFAARKIDL